MTWATPPVPNVASGVPSVLYRRTIASRVLDGLVYHPATTTLPSGWTATACNSAAIPPMFTATFPVVPKELSSDPFGLSRVRTLDRRAMTILSSGATAIDEGGNPVPATLATPPDPNVGSGVPSGRWRVTVRWVLFPQAALRIRPSGWTASAYTENTADVYARRNAGS